MTCASSDGAPGRVRDELIGVISMLGTSQPAVEDPAACRPLGGAISPLTLATTVVAPQRTMQLPCAEETALGTTDTRRHDPNDRPSSRARDARNRSRYVRGCSRLNVAALIRSSSSD